MPSVEQVETMQSKVERLVPKPLALERTDQSALRTTPSTFQWLRFRSTNYVRLHVSGSFSRGPVAERVRLQPRHLQALSFCLLSLGLAGCGDRAAAPAG